MITLTIPRRFKGEFPTIAAAQQRYKELRDESGEGASTWPDGNLKVGKRGMRFSYNGRLWDGARYVKGTPASDLVPLDVAEVDATISKE